MLDDIGLVVLNYLTFEETEEMVVSFKKYYPQVRTLIVDNGSSPEVVSRLNILANSFENTSVLALEKNLGFARGHNAGISKLRKEGYEYICCSNSDIVFVKGGVLEMLKESMIEYNCALAGPKIIDLDENLHFPTIRKPTAYEVNILYHKFNNTTKYKITVKLRSLASKIKNYFMCSYKSKKDSNQNQRFLLYESRKLVYQLKGAFLMFGPKFFNFYDGFDPNTFLYGEERILADMLFSKQLNTIFVPECLLLHKKFMTSNIAFKNDQNAIKKHMKQSFNYWYINYYKKTNIFI